MRHKNTTTDAFKWILLTLIAATAVLGRNLFTTYNFAGEGLYPKTYTVLKILISTVILYYVLTCLLPLLQSSRLTIPGRIIADHRAIQFGIILCIDLFYLIVFSPGTMNWDTYTQINDYYDGTGYFDYTLGNHYLAFGSLNDHHPVLTTLLFGGFVRFGELLGSKEFGYSLFLVLQIILYAYSFVLVTEHIGKTGSQKVHRATALFYCFYPLFSFFAITMVKDSLYSILFLLYYLFFLELYEGKRDRKTLIWFLLLSVLIPLTKKTGIYVVVVSNLALTLHIGFEDGWKKIWAPALSAFLPAFLLFFLLPQIIFPAAQVFPGGKQETYATLFQQTARVKVDHPDYYTLEEQGIIDKLIDYNNMDQLYKQHISDPIKNTYKMSTVTSEDIKAYQKLWIKTGLDHPLTYLKATYGICHPFFAPANSYYFLFTENYLFGLTEQPFSKGTREYLISTHSWLNGIPVINVLFLMCLYCWWIPAYAFYEIITKRGRKYVWLLLPVIMSQLVLVVSPLAYVRYALSLIMIAPLLFCLSRRPNQDTR